MDGAVEKKKRKLQKKRKRPAAREQDAADEFYSPAPSLGGDGETAAAGSRGIEDAADSRGAGAHQQPQAAHYHQATAAAAPSAPRQQQTAQQPVQRLQQQPSRAAVRVEMVILPSPVRIPKRGKRAAGSPAAPAPVVTAAAARSTAAGPAALGAAVRSRAASLSSGQAPAQPAAASAGRAGTAATTTNRTAAAPRQQQAVSSGAVPATVAQAPAPSGAGAGAGTSVPRQKSGSRSSSSSGKKGRQRKTLTAKGKRAAVLGVLADVELQRATGTAQPAAAAEAAVVAGNAAPPGQLASAGRQQQGVSGSSSAAGQQTAEAAVVPEAAPAAAVAEAAVLAEHTANLGRAWSKADIASLARLAEDRSFLLATIPQHPAEGELDWELIARHFGRYSRGGVAVRQQYYSVQRLMKEARHEGRRGVSYVDLVQRALEALPGRRGTVYEVQAVLKRDHCASLDKYRVKGTLRWKSAVGEVLRDQPDIFTQAGKTDTGKIIWQLKAAAAAAAAPQAG